MDLLIVPDTVCAPCLPAPGSLYPLLWPLTCISRPSGASVGPRSSLSLLHPLHSQYLLAVSTHSMTVSLTPITWATGWVLPPTHPPTRPPDPGYVKTHPTSPLTWAVTSTDATYHLIHLLVIRWGYQPFDVQGSLVVGIKCKLAG